MMNNTKKIKRFSSSHINNMEKRYRANFINALSGFKSANLIGTKSSTGIANLAIVSSVFHIGANPPLMGMIMRPHTVSRDTLKNIKDTGVYTINHVNEAIFKHAHQSSASYDSDTDEFIKVGLAQQYVAGINAPFVEQSYIKIALDVQDIQLLAINNTELVIGQVSDVFLSGDIVAEDGYIDIEEANSIAVSGLDSYHLTDRLARLAYAKP